MKSRNLLFKLIALALLGTGARRSMRWPRRRRRKSDTN
jgi:hypothetical protein